MTSPVYEYVTSASTRGAIHVRRQYPHPTTRTLCGAHVPPTWTLGDETVSGHRATCVTCIRRIAREHEAKP